MLFPFIRRVINKLWKITVLCLCFQFVVSFRTFNLQQFIEFFIANELISSNQSGFKPGDSCINQLLSITHEIYKFFDDVYEVRGVFLDISKAFDKVWHNGLIYKLKQNGVSGNLFNLIIDFLDARKQRVVLNGQYSSWASRSSSKINSWSSFFLKIY